MSTYGEKIAQYKAAVMTALELKLEPRKRDLEKLYYYVKRAEKKGKDHKTKFKDDVHWAKKDVFSAAGDLVELAGKVVAEATKVLLEKQVENDEDN